MSDVIRLHFDVAGDNLTEAGAAAGSVKKVLHQLGVDPAVIRRVAVAMYEGEINMVIHADGGTADVEITPEYIKVVLTDSGPGIKDIDLAMTAGYSTATKRVREMGFGAGMGLPNMRSYSDEMNITSEVGVGTTVEILIYTGKDRSPVNMAAEA